MFIFGNYKIRSQIIFIFKMRVWIGFALCTLSSSRSRGFDQYAWRSICWASSKYLFLNWQETSQYLCAAVILTRHECREHATFQFEYVYDCTRFSFAIRQIWLEERKRARLFRLNWHFSIVLLSIFFNW